MNIQFFCAIPVKKDILLAMDAIEIVLFCIILLPVICIAAMVKVCKDVRACYTLPEDKDEFERAKKAALGFKVVAFFLFALPPVLILFALMLMVSGPRHSDPAGTSVVLLYGGFLYSIVFLLSVLISLFGYNYLFLAESDRTAGIILAIPFFPLVISIALAFVAGDFSLGAFVIGIFSLHVISWTLMRIKLAMKRKDW